LGRCPLEQIFDLLFAELNWERAVLEAIAIENIGKRRSDHGPNAEVGNGPNGMFSRGPTPEVPTCQKHLSSLVSILVQFKGWVRRTIFVESPIEKQELPESRSFNSFQKLFRDDLVGIDIGPIHRGGYAGDFGKWLHDFRG
jgi:hypothetical protein